MRDSEGARPRLWHAPANRRTGFIVTAICGSLALLAAACSSAASSPAAHTAGHNGKPGTAPQAANPIHISITPSSGHAAKPNQGIMVTVSGGKLSNVTVTAGRHHSVPGTMSKTGTSWQSAWPLHTGTHYSVKASAAGGGKTATQTSSFRTLNPAATFTAQTVLGFHQTYGVGIPITINFSSPVTRRAAVERAIQITSSNPVVGAWAWDGNESVSFRTRNFWPQHTKVSFDAHFNGLEIARGVYGTQDLSQSFRIGNSLIGVTSTRTHKTRIYWKNKLYAVWPDSSGAPGDDTANGTYLTIEKANPTLMSGPGYTNVPVNWSVRFTWSGNYYHSAPWSVGQQGFSNVSHGCVNLSPAHAQTYYQWAVPGDPITITGSPSSGKWDDGWTQWFLTWNQMLRHSATHMAVEVSPSGSTFVNPSTLPAAPATTRLNGSQPGNFLAG